MSALFFAATEAPVSPVTPVAEETLAIEKNQETATPAAQNKTANSKITNVAVVLALALVAVLFIKY